MTKYLLVVRGDRTDAERAAQEHKLPFTFAWTSKGFRETVGYTEGESLRRVIAWFLEEDSNLLFYTETKAL